jgi:2,3-bisphosphoglycerate-independent phosphoglycerate mutase
MQKRVIVVIRDGWGYRKSHYKNAIYHANTPNTDALMKKYPNTLLKAAGEAVGLPKGYQGNSEVGHMTIGSGRITHESLSKINKAIKDKSFFKNPALLGAIKNCKKHNSALNIMGLVQVEGVHSHLNHLLALLKLCKQQKFNNIHLHVFTDGRDAPVHDAVKNIKNIKSKIATISGRYYAMDRDKRWQRTKKAYDCIVNGKTKITFTNPIKSIKESYKEGITDEFIIPRKREGYKGIKPNDSVIFFNFRTDRPRQLTRAIAEKRFAGWQRKPLNIYLATMTQYYKPLNGHAAFKDVKLKNILGEIISKKNKKQLRISETEKYAHVTYFFNDQIEKPFKKEDRTLIPSPKVATYDQKPEMNVYKVTKELISQIKKKKYDLIVTNLVNCDLVGHTCVWNAALDAVEAVDDCVGKIVKAGIENNYAIIILGDHGNVEDMTAHWCTSHTINPVPCIIISDKKRIRAGGLQDIAPTILDLMYIAKPIEMTGRSLLK